MTHSAVAVLQSKILDEIDPSWFEEIEPELIEAAKNVKHGRRWMAERLSRSFSIFEVPDCEALNQKISEPEGSLFYPQAADKPWDKMILLLGACTQVHSISKIISGDKVRALMDTLNSTHYRKILHFARQFDSESSVLVGNVFLPSDVWGKQLKQKGANELYCFAKEIHPYLAERVQAMHPKGFIINEGSLLTSEMVRFLLDDDLLQALNAQEEVV